MVSTHAPLGIIQHGLSYYGAWHVLSLKIGTGGILNVLAISSFEPFHWG